MDGVIMNKDFFNEQVKKLVVEYQDKGFTMNKERATQWFKYFGNLSESKFEKSIEEVLKTVSYCPTMADIFKTGAFQQKEVKKLNRDEILGVDAEIKEYYKTLGG